MSKHHPGPWKAWDSPAGEHDPLPVWTVSDCDGNDICTLQDWLDGPEPAIARRTAATAALIAAAPDLLAALREFIAIDSRPYEPSPGTWAAAIVMARAAFNKATNQIRG